MTANIDFFESKHGSIVNEAKYFQKEDIPSYSAKKTNRDLNGFKNTHLMKSAACLPNFNRIENL